MGDKNIPIALAMPSSVDEPMQMESSNNLEFEEPMTPTTRAETESRMALEDGEIREEPERAKKNNYHFQDKVIVNGETLFEISDDKVFHEEQRLRRNTRWTDPVSRKRKFYHIFAIF